jgi:peptide-methionine (S)-S-oxide reductase
MFFKKSSTIPSASEALPGRETPMPVNVQHSILKHPLKGPYPDGLEMAVFGLGCFWGAERKFWQLGDGVYVTAVGYAGGHTPNPTYEEVCSGRTGHNEVVLVVYDPKVISYERLLQTFCIYVFTPPQRAAAEASKAAYEKALAAKGYGPITTEIVDKPAFYFAEDYHQQYLAKNPAGYCGLGGTGVSCPIGVGVTAQTEAAQ